MACVCGGAQSLRVNLDQPRRGLGVDMMRVLKRRFNARQKLGAEVASHAIAPNSNYILRPTLHMAGI